MKRLFLILLFLNIFLTVSAQSTWVQKLGHKFAGTYSHDDSLTGIKCLDIGPDGDIYVVANFGLSNESRLFKISSTGAPIKWMTQVGYHGGTTAQFTNSLHATSDSGCIIASNFLVFGVEQRGYLKKYSKQGNLTWEHEFKNNFSPHYIEAFDAIQNVAGNYYALIGDTLFELDNSGNEIRYDSTISGKKIIELSSGNLLIQTLNDMVICRPFGGPDVWSISSAKLITCNSEYAFIESSADIQKIDLLNGSSSWTKSYPWTISDADTTSDGGFISCAGTPPNSNCNNCLGPGIVFKVDSLGDTLWSRSYSLPKYGFGKIKRTSSGNLITGGAFIYIISWYFNFKEYSSFITALDSSGNGVLETAEYIWPGNANNNQLLDLSDDALYTVLAFGKTGPPRDTIDTLSYYGECCISDYAIDWPDTSVIGVNLKSSDFNGDGILDTNDIEKYTRHPLGYPLNLPSFKLANPKNDLQSIPILEIIPEDDTINPGDTVNFFIIAGSSTIPIDTICGIAFTGMWPWMTIDASVNELSSDLGTIGNDLYSFSRTIRYSGPLNYFLNCRTNGQDAYHIYDTLGIITVVCSDTLTQIDSVSFTFHSANAIKCNGEIIPLNFVSHSAILLPESSGMSDIDLIPVQLFPNPSSDVLNIDLHHFSGERMEGKIFNSTGNLVYQLTISDKLSHLSTKELANGIYFLSIQNSEGVFHKSFAVQH